MSFVKLDCGILNSTLWVEKEPRDIFITALLMAEPMELKEQTPQLHVRRLEETGFSVPPGWYGFVPAAGPGIVRMAMSDMELGLAALEKLGAPDQESRTPDFDGRRLVRINGGYLVLNYMKYRDRDYTGAERARRYRERQKLKNITRDSLTSRRDITQAEAEAEAEAENTLAPAELVETSGSDAYRVPNCPFEKLANAYHEALPMLPRMMIWSTTRQKHVRARWAQVCSQDKMDLAKGLDWFTWFFSRVAASAFLTGQASTKDRPWRADFDWLFMPGNFAKIIEGRYHQ